VSPALDRDDDDGDAGDRDVERAGEVGTEAKRTAARLPAEPTTPAT
jgi:hypothetical protein